MVAKRKELTRRTGPAVHDDLLQHRFTAGAANRVRLTDITKHPTTEGRLHLYAVKDVSPAGSSATPSAHG
ncbi:hypothetical protein GCM10009779_70180 [Polymorphospora rubra]|uniref:Uncharacterized protein n=1 Tax=Polymorphospora rubra TaxID=338584 RepID=A0A810NBF0_9ACTN|nr:hypothetical protein Prubr_64400 [Polymorphospora rubra]